MFKQLPHDKDDTMSNQAPQPCSVIIGCHNRRGHLLRQLNSVLAANCLPTEVVVVTDDLTIEQLQPLIQTGIQVRLLPVAWAPNSDRFDIGRQRARGAQHATQPWLIFLDVDCMISSTFIEQMMHALHTSKTPKHALVMGEPHYLPHTDDMPSLLNTIRADDRAACMTHWHKLSERLMAADQQHWQQYMPLLAISHPRRPLLEQAVTATQDYGSFWSLCFALHQQAYQLIGGFDAEYTGYGAEDTDFAFMAREHGVAFYLCQAKAYHQQHVVYRPPLNHLSSIAINANRFYDKWQHWPMGGWLKAFCNMGLINWQPSQTKPIEIINQPTDEQMAKACAPKARFV